MIVWGTLPRVGSRVIPGSTVTVRPMTSADRIARTAGTSLAALARDLEAATRALEDRVPRLAATGFDWEVKRLLARVEAVAAPAAVEGLALWRRVIEDPDPKGRLNQLMERPCHLGMMAVAATAVLEADMHPRTRPGRTVHEAMAAFVTLDEALGRIAARHPSARRQAPAPIPVVPPAPTAVTPREGAAFQHAFEVLAPALSRHEAGLMPFEPGFEEEAARGAARQNARGGALAVPVLLRIGAAQVPSVVQGEAGAVASLLEAALLMGARPTLSPALLEVAGVPPGALPPSLLSRLASEPGAES